MSNEYDPPPWNPPPPPPPPPYPPADTGLILQGDVAALRREVRVLRTLNATVQAENTQLRRQVAELTDHNAELLRDKWTLRWWCQAQHATARDRRLTDVEKDEAWSPQDARFRAYWLGRSDAMNLLWTHIKPPDATESPDSTSGPPESPTPQADH
jgi:hypothetical protein